MEPPFREASFSQFVVCSLGGYRFAQLVRMLPERLHEHIEEHLKALASERFLLLCSPNF